MYAVIKAGGKQYRVADGDVIQVNRLTYDIGQSVEIDDVLMVGGEQVQVGTPLVAGARVVAEVLAHPRGEKVIIFKKKRRHNYRRRNGHRQDLTTLKITDILLAGAKPAAKAAKPAAEAKKPAPAAETKKAATTSATEKKAAAEPKAATKPAAKPAKAKAAAPKKE